MKKTLIIITHPDIDNSVINKRQLTKLEKYPEKFYIHQLHKVYPDQKFDIAAEQKLIEEHNHIIFQFPYYWYYAPSLLEKGQTKLLHMVGLTEVQLGTSLISGRTCYQYSFHCKISFEQIYFRCLVYLCLLTSRKVSWKRK